jgi:hypothetical protein
VVAATAAFALVSYMVGQRSARRSRTTGLAAVAAAGAEATTIYDGEDEGDFHPPDPHQPYDEPLPYDGPPPDDADLAGWQIEEPSWGPDRTTVDPDRTTVDPRTDTPPR